MFNRLLIGAGAVLVLAVGGLFFAWRDARDDAQAATTNARLAQASLEQALADAEKSDKVASALNAALVVRETQHRQTATELAETRRTLKSIREQARKETANESLACAVRPVPDAVDHLLRGAAYRAD